MIKKIFHMLLLGVVVSQSVAAAELNIEITQGVDNPIPIAVVPFTWQGGIALGEEIDRIVSADLQQVGEFRALSPANMLSMPDEASEVYFRDWRILAQDYLLIGKVNHSPGSQLVQVQYEFFDVTREQKLVGEMLTGSIDQLRDIAHEISNVVYEQVTGNRGAFSTEILYVSAQFISPELTYYRIEKADYDGHRSQVLVESQEPLMSPAWSPDGRQIAYLSFETNLPRIYIQEIATGERRQITDFPGINSSPVWSPDGTKLAMVLSKDGSPDVYVMDLMTSQLTRLTDHPRAETEPSWTADSRSVLFTSDRTGQPQIYQVPITGGFPERLTFDCFYCAKGRFLPDGKNLVHVRRDTREDNSYSIAIFNIDTQRVITLTDTSLDESPSVAPNGSMIMFATTVNGRGILDAVSIDGRVKFRLPSSQGDVREPSWSPFLN
ncbi:MAG: Tol-Pal system beta propeller repeat protein TolB [Gammaproteobacteria bacterium]|nr:Tol-Pal system beta propeller repeat protein TolB [Gammaproteobacteria bacterium]MDP2139308.1 Tol-Pal system beta propeller repeat protein TolB [Gammaproteobacteria bacterium]MDP2346865.1 Tol-Pal system beta propeller repeat protein TolB [Gammaproteobacteria bacterium]